MKIIKQLSEDEFIIKMEEKDLQREKRIIVAHDYVQFNKRMGIVTDSKMKENLYGKYAMCANWIYAQFDVQLGIRAVINFILPFLNSHKYCQKEHLLNSDASPNYCSCDDIIFFTDKNKEMVAIRGNGEENFSIISKSTYNTIKSILE